MDLFAEMLLARCAGIRGLRGRERLSRLSAAVSAACRWLGRRAPPSTPTACSTACGTTPAACGDCDRRIRPVSRVRSQLRPVGPRPARGAHAASTATTSTRSAACSSRRASRGPRWFRAAGPARPERFAEGGRGLLQHRRGPRTDREPRPDRPRPPGLCPARRPPRIHTCLERPGEAAPFRRREAGRSCSTSAVASPASASTCLSVFARMLKDVPHLVLVQIGGRWTEPQLEQIERLGIGPVLLQARGLTRERLAALYRAAALVLQPSEAEGFGLPLAEALACGRLSWRATCPSLREVGGPAAVYCPVGEVAAWTAAASALIVRPGWVPSRAARWRGTALFVDGPRRRHIVRLPASPGSLKSPRLPAPPHPASSSANGGEDGAGGRHGLKGG